MASTMNLCGKPCSEECPMFDWILNDGEWMGICRGGFQMTTPEQPTTLSTKPGQIPSITVGAGNVVIPAERGATVLRVHPKWLNPKYMQQWVVRSDSFKSVWYKISQAKDGHFECSCKGWINHRKDCKHIKRVKKKLTNLAGGNP